MTRKSKYPVYLNAGNVLVPYDPDKPLSKLQIILVSVLTLGAIIMIIVALATSSETMYDCSVLGGENNRCPSGYGIPETSKKKYTKGKEQDDCCVAYDKGKCTRSTPTGEGICPKIKFKNDCNKSIFQCTWN
jgi:hypothetical protein